jgi:hypothetical protein
LKRTSSSLAASGDVANGLKIFEVEDDRVVTATVFDGRKKVGRPKA